MYNNEITCRYVVPLIKYDSIETIDKHILPDFHRDCIID